MPIIAVDPNNPATARPRFGGVASGVGVGLSVGIGVGVEASVGRGVAVDVAAGVDVGASVGSDVGGAVGSGVAVGGGVETQNGGRHGVSVGSGEGEGDGGGVGVCWICALAASVSTKSAAISSATNAPSLRNLHLNDEVRLRGPHARQIVDAFENDLRQVSIVGELAESEDVGLPPTRMRLLHTVDRTDRSEHILRVPCFDRNQDVRRCPHADSPQTHIFCRDYECNHRWSESADYDE